MLAAAACASCPLPTATPLPEVSSNPQAFYRPVGWPRCASPAPRLSTPSPCRGSKVLSAGLLSGATSVSTAHCQTPNHGQLSHSLSPTPMVLCSRSMSRSVVSTPPARPSSPSNGAAGAAAASSRTVPLPSWAAPATPRLLELRPCLSPQPYHMTARGARSSSPVIGQQTWSVRVTTPPSQVEPMSQGLRLSHLGCSPDRAASRDVLILPGSTSEHCQWQAAGTRRQSSARQVATQSASSLRSKSPWEVRHPSSPVSPLQPRGASAESSANIGQSCTQLPTTSSGPSCSSVASAVADPQQRARLQATRRELVETVEQLAEVEATLCLLGARPRSLDCRKQAPPTFTELAKASRVTQLPLTLSAVGAPPDTLLGSSVKQEAALTPRASLSPRIMATSKVIPVSACSPHCQLAPPAPACVPAAVRLTASHSPFLQRSPSRTMSSRTPSPRSSITLIPFAATSAHRTCSPHSSLGSCQRGSSGGRVAPTCVPLGPVAGPCLTPTASVVAFFSNRFLPAGQRGSRGGSPAHARMPNEGQPVVQGQRFGQVLTSARHSTAATVGSSAATAVPSSAASTEGGRPEVSKLPVKGSKGLAGIYGMLDACCPVTVLVGRIVDELLRAPPPHLPPDSWSAPNLRRTLILLIAQATGGPLEAMADEHSESNAQPCIDGNSFLDELDSNSTWPVFEQAVRLAGAGSDLTEKLTIQLLAAVRVTLALHRAESGAVAVRKRTRFADGAVDTCSNDTGVAQAQTGSSLDSISTVNKTQATHQISASTEAAPADDARRPSQVLAVNASLGTLANTELPMDGSLAKAQLRAEDATANVLAIDAPNTSAPMLGAAVESAAVEASADVTTTPTTRPSALSLMSPLPASESCCSSNLATVADAGFAASRHTSPEGTMDLEQQRCLVTPSPRVSVDRRPSAGGRSQPVSRMASPSARVTSPGAKSERALPGGRSAGLAGPRTSSTRLSSTAAKRRLSQSPQSSQPVGGLTSRLPSPSLSAASAKDSESTRRLEHETQEMADVSPPPPPPRPPPVFAQVLAATECESISDVVGEVLQWPAPPLDAGEPPLPDGHRREVDVFDGPDAVGQRVAAQASKSSEEAFVTPALARAGNVSSGNTRGRGTRGRGGRGTTSTQRRTSPRQGWH